MDTDPDRTVGHTDLSGESDFHPAAPATIVATPAVAHPGAGLSSAMVTRRHPAPTVRSGSVSMSLTGKLLAIYLQT